MMQLAALFSSFGTIEELKIHLDKETGEPKGSETVSFDKFASAALATSLHRSQTLPGSQRPIEVYFVEDAHLASKPVVPPKVQGPPPPPTRLFVSNVPQGIVSCDF